MLSTLTGVDCVTLNFAVIGWLRRNSETRTLGGLSHNFTGLSLAQTSIHQIRLWTPHVPLRAAEITQSFGSGVLFLL